DRGARNAPQKVFLPRSPAPVPLFFAVRDSVGAGNEGTMAERRLKFWGWGYEGEGATAGEREAIKRFYGGMFALDAFPDDVPRAGDYALAKPRVKPPKSLAAICADDAHTRLVHALGKSFPDAVRVFDRKIPHAPDVVVFPRNEKEVAAAMDWAASAKAALVPFGG